MRFHLLPPSHTVTSPEYNACAFTQKVLKFAKMMKARGHTIIHYGHEDSQVDCDEHVTVTTNDDLKQAYGSYDWRKEFFKHNTGDYCYKITTERTIQEVAKRKQPYDFLLPFFGWGNWPVCEAHSDMIVVEPGIGYPSVTPARWKVFESYAIYHAWCGIDAVGTCKQDNYHVVIPNYFDPDDFTFNDKKEDYFLFLGRVYQGKGVHIAIEVCQKLGKKLIIAGQTDGSIQIPADVEYVGYADIEKRRTLMANAKASFVASQYLEPFGGVAVENLFSGTPIITSDWGAMTEYCINNYTGYRCRTFGDYINAVNNIHKINPYNCRKIALDRYSLDIVALMYEKYFQDILNVYTGNGWYQL